VDTRKWVLSKALPKIFGDKVEHTGTVQTAATDDGVKAHLEVIAKRFGDEAKQRLEKVDHMAGLNARFGSQPKGKKLNGSTPASSSSDAALNKAAAEWCDEHGVPVPRRRDN
jgi:hypothetical protein